MEMSTRFVSRIRRVPIWIDLVAAQVHVDAGRTGAGRAALARFESGWDGQPEALKGYVAELNRYLESH